MAEAERVTVGGQTLLVCAGCRFATELGKSWSPVYSVPQPGIPNPDPNDKQALCTTCYLQQFQQIYPGEPLPELPDGRREDLGVIPRGRVKNTVTSGAGDLGLWQAALDRAKASQGAETVPQAYAILTGSSMEIEGGDPVGISPAS